MIVSLFTIVVLMNNSNYTSASVLEVVPYVRTTVQLRISVCIFFFKPNLFIDIAGPHFSCPRACLTAHVSQCLHCWRSTNVGERDPNTIVPWPWVWATVIGATVVGAPVIRLPSVWGGLCLLQQAHERPGNGPIFVFKNTEYNDCSYKTSTHGLAIVCLCVCDRHRVE